ncbi:MAG: PadR family transcriptional regulator [Methyloligellaceae bacterium]
MNVRSLCLGILWFDDATGYEINKLAAEGRFSHFIEASYGSIYPALNKLTEEGLVTWREETQAGKPARKVYSITENGRTAHVQALHEGPKPDIFKSEFLFLCLYSDFLDHGYMSQVTDMQIAQIEEGLERLRMASAKCEHAKSCFTIGYGKALHEAALDYLKENRHLIEGSTEAKHPQAAE